MAEQQDELISAAEAGRILGVSKTTLTAMFRDGRLNVVKVNPLDKRERLVSRAAVEALLRDAGKAPKQLMAAA